MIPRRALLEYAAEAPGVFAIPLYDAATCRHMVESAEAARLWREAAVFSGPREADGEMVDPAQRSACVTALADLPELGQAFDASVQQIITPLVYQQCRVRLPRYAEAQIVRYRPGGEYMVHQDRGAGAWNRYFTIVCYLNDDFTGGATRFPQLGYSSTPRTGKAIVFLADYWHCAEPIESGCKYVLVAWLVGSDPIRWI